MNILVFTVSSWNSKNGSNTWTSLLDGYDPATIANICIRDEIPDSTSCSRYFSISENKIIKSILNRRIKTGREIRIGEPPCHENNTDLIEHNARYQRMTVKRRYSMLMVRELIWKLGKWKTKELDAFLDDFGPDIILHSMEGYIHLNRVIEYAIKRTGAKAIGYIWDDNFTYSQSNKIGHKIYRFFQRHSLKNLAKKTTSFFAISPFTKKEADAFFKIDCNVLTKPLSKEPVAKAYSQQLPYRMLYTGNLLIGRDRSLVLLCKMLKVINKEQLRIVLDVYTKTVLPPQMLDLLECEYCHIHAPISQTEVLKKQEKADILLFLEDIDGKDSKAARLSFSTKITDYLSVGKCILAIGNKETAPMQYFIENDAAVVCDSSESIFYGLEKMLSNTDNMDYYAQKACEAGSKNHNPEIIRNLFSKVIVKAFQNRANNID